MCERFCRCASLMAAVCIVIICAALAGSNMTEQASAAAGGLQRVIIIDAGHGGFDGGAVAHDGTVEKDINLNIALSLRSMLELGGFRVIMTRTGDVATDDVETREIGTRKRSDLKNRLELMRDYPDSLFVSIHLNKFTTTSAKGAQVFFSPRTSGSQELGECIQRSVVSLLQPENRRVIKKGTSAAFLLDKATVPAVIVECGFLSNKSELERLKDTEYQRKMAFAVYAGITEYTELN